VWHGHARPWVESPIHLGLPEPHAHGYGHIYADTNSHIYAYPHGYAHGDIYTPPDANVPDRRL